MQSIQKLLEHIYPSVDLQRAAALLSWDQEVNMPPLGAQARGNQLATLSRLAHEHFASEKTAKLLETAENETKSLQSDSIEKAHVRIIRREFGRATRLPATFVEELSLAISSTFESWKKAREENRYDLFKDDLEKMVELNRKKASYLGYEKSPYDALLDLYEPDMKSETLDPLFLVLSEELKKRIPEIVKKNQDIPLPWGAAFAIDKQKNVAMSILRTMGYDFQRGRLDQSPHPFTTSFSLTDVRVTTRFHEDSPLPAIFAAMHEGGHALYEQGIPHQYERTLLGEGASLGVHESQSRIWENHVGRSEPFLRYLYSAIVREFDLTTRSEDLESFLQVCKHVTPSLIRVEADEVTYNMHVIIRYRIEKDLLEDRLDTRDARDAWNDLYNKYLALTPRDDASGILQDVHWSHGSFGYFPTYTIGNLMAAILFEEAKKEHPAMESDFLEGRTDSLLGFLRTHVHGYGAQFSTGTLLEREFGKELSVHPFLNHIDERYLGT